MKRVLSLLVALCLLLCACAFAEETEQAAAPAMAKVKVRLNTTCVNISNVGTDWINTFSVNQQKIVDSAVLVLTEGGIIPLFAQFKENDSIPDIAYRTQMLTVDKELLENGAEIAFNVEVTENNGRRKGKSCTWTVVFIFEPLGYIDPLFGVEVDIIADTVAHTETSGNVTYHKKGEKLTVTGYAAAMDRFIAQCGESSGYISGNGLDISREQLVYLFVDVNGAKSNLDGVPVKVTAKTVAITAADGTITYVHTGAAFTVTGYSADTDRFTVVCGDVTGEIKGVGLNYTKEKLIELLNK